jgi:hypothetical protein
MAQNAPCQEMYFVISIAVDYRTEDGVAFSMTNAGWAYLDISESAGFFETFGL